MTVALPDGDVNNADMYFVDRGGVLHPSLGGPDQRMERVGSKWGGVFTTAPMKGEDARIWIARLVRGVREKASLKFPQPGIVIPQSVDYTVSGAVAANAVNILVATVSNGEIGKTFKEGQFITVIQGGVRYVYQVTADTVVSAGKTANLPVQPPVRVALTNGSIVEVLAPRIEGFVKNDATRWSVDNAKIYGFQFSIDEAR